MGVVYEGVNERIGRRVAIKVLHAEAAVKPELRRRFEREALVAGKLASPHICEVLDVGDLPDGDLYIVMEFLEGSSLSDVIEGNKRLSLAEFAPIWYQLLEGLRVLHDAGIVHRDLKPANIFVSRTASGQPHTKLLDFGVSKWTTVPENATSSGAIMGTPLFMAPEQARGLANKVDARTDIYAAGVCAYTVLSGTVPFEGENVHDLLFRIALTDAPPLEIRAPWISPAVAFLVHRAMARDPEQRFQSAREFQADLVSVLERELATTKSGVSTLVAGLQPQSASWRPSSASVRASGRVSEYRSDPAKATQSVWSGSDPPGSRAQSKSVRWPVLLGAALTAVILGGGIVWMWMADARAPGQAAGSGQAASPPVAATPPVVPAATQPEESAALDPLPTADAPEAGPGPGRGHFRVQIARPPRPPASVAVPPGPTTPAPTSTTPGTPTGRVIRKEL